MHFIDIGANLAARTHDVLGEADNQSISNDMKDPEVSETPCEPGPKLSLFTKMLQKAVIGFFRARSSIGRRFGHAGQCRSILVPHHCIITVPKKRMQRFLLR